MAKAQAHGQAVNQCFRPLRLDIGSRRRPPNPTYEGLSPWRASRKAVLKSNSHGPRASIFSTCPKFVIAGVTVEHPYMPSLHVALIHIRGPENGAFVYTGKLHGARGRGSELQRLHHDVVQKSWEVLQSTQRLTGFNILL